MASAPHFSGRGLLDRNRTLWSSFVIQSDNRKVFFPGDTGRTEQFRDVGAQRGPFDLVMLEGGAFHESWGDIHLGPENALKAFDMIGGRTLLPIHWGTFSLPLHDWDEPGENLLQLATAAQARIIIPRLGEAIGPDHVEGPSPWWRGVTPRLPR